MPRLSSRQVNPGARNIPYTGEERCQANQGLRTGSRLRYKTQADRHQAWKACTTVIISEAQPALSYVHCNPINSNQPAHHGDYFKTNGGFKPLENGFGKCRLKPEKNCFMNELCRIFTHQEQHIAAFDDIITDFNSPPSITMIRISNIPLSVLFFTAIYTRQLAPLAPIARAHPLFPEITKCKVIQMVQMPTFTNIPNL